jgi:hypothetical protein
MNQLLDWLLRKTPGVSEHGTPLRLIPKGCHEHIRRGEVWIVMPREMRSRYTVSYLPIENGLVVQECYGYGCWSTGSMLDCEIPKNIRKWAAFRRSVTP